MTRLVSLINNRGITMIHRRACHMAQRGRATEWPHGDQRTGTQLAIDSARLGFRPCRRCRPFPQPDPTRMPGYVRPTAVIATGRVEAQGGVA